MLNEILAAIFGGVDRPKVVSSFCHHRGVVFCDWPLPFLYGLENP